MIKAYLTAISSIYEGEDIEIRYCIYEDQELSHRNTVIMGYEKPAIVGQVALIALLKELEKVSDQEIVIIVNDPALSEFVKGTSTTKNKDVLRMGRVMRKELSKFKSIIIQDVHGDKAELTKWNEILRSDFLK